jgi:hypothetical protein
VNPNNYLDLEIATSFSSTLPLRHAACHYNGHLGCTLTIPGGMLCIEALLAEPYSDPQFLRWPYLLSPYPEFSALNLVPLPSEAPSPTNPVPRLLAQM